MRFVRFLPILALLTGALLTSCGARQARDTAVTNAVPAPNASAPRTSVEELGLVINIPYEAEDAVWKDDPSQKKLTAVLRFDPQDTAKIVAAAEKTRPPQPATLASETWFPPDLLAESEVRGVDEILGKAYAANQFFQGDYTDGRLIRVDGNDYLILELTGK